MRSWYFSSMSLLIILTRCDDPATLKPVLNFLTDQMFACRCRECYCWKINSGVNEGVTQKGCFQVGWNLLRIRVCLGGNRVELVGMYLDCSEFLRIQGIGWGNWSGMG